MVRPPYAAVLTASLFAFAAGAQPLGLDLSQEGPDLRPSLAIVGLSVGSGADATKARRVEAALVASAKDSGAFARMLTADDVAAMAALRPLPVSACTDSSCLEKLAVHLGVDRLVTGTFDAAGAHLVFFDWGVPTSEPLDVPSNALAPKQMKRLIDPPMRKLVAPLGEATIKVNVEGAEVFWGDRLLGKGPDLKVYLPAGRRTLRVTAEGYEPAEEPLQVDSNDKTSTEVQLERVRARPIATPVAPDSEPELSTAAVAAKAPPAKDASKPILERPGIYVAAAGAVALIAAAALGVTVQLTEARATDADADGAIDVTRAEAKSAERNATIANVLGGLGGAALVGGGVWVVMDSAPAKRSAALHSKRNFTGGIVVNGSF